MTVNPLVLHVALACSFATAAVVAERRFRRRLAWPWGMLASAPVFVVLALEVVQLVESGAEGGLRAIAWFFGMVVGMPAAVLAAWLTSWWMVGIAGLSCSTWCVMMAVAYVLLIASTGLGQ